MGIKKEKEQVRKSRAAEERREKEGQKGGGNREKMEKGEKRKRDLGKTGGTIKADMRVKQTREVV